MNEPVIIASAVYVITLLLQIKIFARTDEVKNLEIQLIKYVNDNFVQNKIYMDNQNEMRKQLSQVHADINDIKQILISMVKKQ